MPACIPKDLSFSLTALAGYYAGGGRVEDVVRAALERIRRAGDNPIWISRFDDEALLLRARALDASPDARALPLFGVPFAVKDNIDVAGLPTTAACPAFAYQPMRSASAVQRLLDAGAICLGKTNLDQFATGLVGTRSPYGEVRNAFDGDYISGGSSAGSAVAVALGQVSFALGTDTAGSGRVPAGLNNIVGLKPTRGRISARGVVPACRSLDCVSVFAATPREALQLMRTMAGPDAEDAFSRTLPETRAPAKWRIGVPDARSLQFFGDRLAEEAFAASLSLLERLDARLVPIDLTPFREVAELLYSGAWIAEREAAVGGFLRTNPDDVLPVIREVIGAASRYSAADAFRAQYRLAELHARIAPLWESFDALLVPTAPTVFTREAVRAAPVERNSAMGLYTNFVNLLDLAALAVPFHLREDRLPFGVTLIGGAGSEAALCELGERLHAASGMTLGATGAALHFDTPQATSTLATSEIAIAVVGAHLSGEPLNPPHQ